MPQDIARIKLQQITKIIEQYESKLRSYPDSLNGTYTKQLLKIAYRRAGYYDQFVW